MDCFNRQKQITNFFGHVPTLDEVARILVLDYLSHLSPIRSTIYYLDGKDHLSRLASYGISREKNDVISDVERGIRITGERWRTAVNERGIFVLQASTESPVSWAEDREKVVINLYARNSLMGMLVLEFAAPIEVTEKINLELGLYGSPISLYIILRFLDNLQNQGDSFNSSMRPNKTGVGDDLFLTERQRLVLSGLIAMKTNNSIAEDLGYSVSTIRQEVSRLFQIMNVSGRAEAAARGSEFIESKSLQSTSSST